MPILGAGLATRRTPERNSPLLSSGVNLVKRALSTITVTSGTTPVTLTAAQVLKGFLPVDCQDTGTSTLPTATLLNAAIEGVEVGTSFAFTIWNGGDSTLTLAVGTGITAKTVDSESAVLTNATHCGSTFLLSCTGVANPSDPSTSDSWDLYPVVGTGTLSA